MEFFNKAKAVRLRSFHGKYLVADEDEEMVHQSKNGSSRRAHWAVEYVAGNCHVVRLRSCYGKYLTATEAPYLFSISGKKVVQSIPQSENDKSIEWEPRKDGTNVKLRAKGGMFLRGNSSMPPWRNSVTHDLPHRAATQDWLLWDVDMVELMVDHRAADSVRSHLSSHSSCVSSSSEDYSVDEHVDPGSRSTSGTEMVVSRKPSHSSTKTGEELLVVVGGGAAGVYGAIRAKTVAPHLNVLVIEKGKLLSKVKISGGGRCNVTNGQCTENLILADHYPRGHRELRGSFFSTHGPTDTMTWFSEHGVKLKTEDDGRVFPISDSSSSIIDCLLSEAKQKGVLIQTGKVVTSASRDIDGNFLVKIEKRTTNYMENLKADYLLIASGSSQQGYVLTTQLGHSIVDPVPSLFTFKIEDSQLAELSGITFPKVRVKLKLENVQTNIPQLTQVGPMLVTHWGLSGPAILRLSAWGARHLFSSDYEGDLFVDFVPDIKMEDLKSILMKQKHQFTKQKLLNACPLEFGIVKRFWKYILDREGVDADILWASISNNSLIGIASLLKQCMFRVMGKGQFKDEFVTAGGVPLSEISLSTMESKIQPHLFLAGEVLNVDGVTGGFNFQNAWSGGYIAGTNIGNLALDAKMKEVDFGTKVEHGKTPS